MRIPYIFDIQRSSTVDGPGLRSVVFFKGCNLDCFWCHNPEGKSPLPQGACFSEKCTHCGVCRSVCQNALCTLCGDCTRYCPEQARKIYGRIYGEDELLDILLKDLPYYSATGGGVTFSGGECMLYPEFLTSMARKCRDAGISVAVDTAGCVPYEHFLPLLPLVDLFLYDIKCLDADLHKKGTGVDNAQILENLDRLQKSGARILVRTPIIPDFNDGEEQKRIAELCRERGLPWEALPYHRFGESKRAALSAPFKK